MGSRLCGAGTFFAADPEPWRTAGRAALAGSATGSVVPDAVEAMVEDEGMNQYPMINSATTPNTAAAIVCFRFSIPSFTQAPDRR